MVPWEGVLWEDAMLGQISTPTPASISSSPRSCGQIRTVTRTDQVRVPGMGKNFFFTLCLVSISRCTKLCGHLHMDVSDVTSFKSSTVEFTLGVFALQYVFWGGGQWTGLLQLVRSFICHISAMCPPRCNLAHLSLTYHQPSIQGAVFKTESSSHTKHVR